MGSTIPWLLVLILAISVYFDVRNRRIPNLLTFPAALAGIALHTFNSGIHGFSFSITGLILGLAVLLPFYAMGGMGAGDVKLMGAVGAFLGPKGLFIAFLLTGLVGGIYALILFALHGHLKNTLMRYGLMAKMILVGHKIAYIPAPPEAAGKPKLRYAVAIAIGTVLSFFVAKIY